MSSIANLVISDGTVNHTYYPIQSGASCKWVTHSGANASVQETVFLNASLATPTRPTDKYKIGVFQPIPQTVDGVVTPRNVNKIIMDVNIGEQCSDAERLAFYNLGKNALANALLTGAVTGRDLIF